MKYKLFVNQHEMGNWWILLSIIIMGSNKWTGFGFLGFILLLVDVIDHIEISELKR